MKILQNIFSSQDVKELEKSDLPELCSEIREFLIYNVSKTGGHLSSNLGVVEITVALHRLFDLSKDRLVFDVGHQSYVHKMLSGRREGFATLRKLGGISGFPKPCESNQDAFIAGHASNSISVALGMARSRTLLNETYHVISLVGDGSLTGGLAYEALNDAGQSGEPLIVILNDNGMSIANSVGGISKHLGNLRMRPGYYNFKKRYRNFCAKVPGGKKLYSLTHKLKTTIKNAILHCSMFEEMGFHYLGPVDGHDINQVLNVIDWAKRISGPVLVHVCTVKGKGYTYSELDPDEYHGVGAFDPSRGINEDEKKDCFSLTFGETMIQLASKYSNICAITAAMQAGTGLSGFARKFPDRFFDVGIAEGHAAAMAGGMAKQGMVPVFAVYSSFLQRAYDMLIHDIALQNLHVILAVDRAGVVGADGETHQGVFDVGFLCGIPNMTVLCPASYGELQEMLRQSVLHGTGPVAIRYPKGKEGAYKGVGEANKRASILRQAEDVTLISYGIMINNTLQAAMYLRDMGIQAQVIKLASIKPIDMETITAAVRKTGKVFIIEDTVSEGCVGLRILAELCDMGVEIKVSGLINLGDDFVTQGETAELHKLCGIDADSIARAVADNI